MMSETPYAFPHILIWQAATQVEAGSTVNDTEGTRIADAIGFPDVNSLFSFGALNGSADVSAIISEGIPGWAATQANAGGGVSAEALEEIMRVQANNIVNSSGKIMASNWLRTSTD